MEYSIKKDKEPKETIEYIKKILEKHSVKTTENINFKGKYAHAVQINIPAINISSQGKGTNEIHALASGYAELMEYIQAQIYFAITGKNFCYDPDEKIYNIEKLHKNIFSKEYNKLGIDVALVNNIAKNLNFTHTKEDSKSKSIKQNQTNLVPFVSCKTKKINFLPLDLIRFEQNSNGTAAGNTYEEACVQALSEIFERYSLRMIFQENIKIPNIPQENYQKYEKITSLISEIENYGYKITIKDASLGKGIPTICTTFKDLRYPKNGISFKLGTHPYFPIAIERTLTEFIQNGIKPDDIRKKEKFQKITNDSTTFQVIQKNFRTKSFFDINSKHIRQLISQKSDYRFDIKTWLLDESLSNKEMLERLLNTALKFADDVYVRNYNFLGLPTVYIYIPNISRYCAINKQYYDKWLNVFNWRNYTKNTEIEKLTLENLYNACDFLSCTATERHAEICNFSTINPEFIALYCAILLQSKRKIKKYIRIIMRKLCVDNKIGLNENLTFYQALHLFFKLLFAKLSLEEIKPIIEKKYSEKSFADIVSFLSNLNFDEIKKLIENNPIQEIYESDSMDPFTVGLSQFRTYLHNYCKKHPPKQTDIIKMLKGNVNVIEKIDELTGYKFKS